MKYNHKKIEKKWQKIWDEEKTFRTDVSREKEKCYVLDMFPYPSGSGLHVGHPLGYTATDIYSRFKRLNNFNVLHPMGWDAFGLPAEQYALKTGTHPRVTTEKNIKRYREQLKMLGFSYDWDREVNTTDPKYYKWTQWIFLQLYNRGLAYEAEVPVNWCPELKAVLSNEEVVDGKSDIGGHPVERLPMRQWMLKITDYAESLLDGLDDLDWPESVKELQRNWIGKSEGCEVNFKLLSLNQNISVYTTRPDTLFGATYMVLAPEHPLVDKLVVEDQISNVNDYKKFASLKSDFDRGEMNKEKTGVPLGAYATNPVNNQKIPIWIADYVLMSYGTGAIMAVPAHDERDYEFAKKFNLPITEVVSGGNIEIEVHTDTSNGTMVNSSNGEGLNLNDLKVNEAIKVVIDWLEKEELGKRKTQYKLRDWLFSRQRYWGEPMPIIHNHDGSITALNNSDLPLTLPEVKKYEPSGTGESPLSVITDWVDVDGGKRETNTMPQWAGSCWYYLRYISPHNDEFAWDSEDEKYWMPVDLYVGGVEHAVLHLLYSRFWHHVLHDLGLVSTREPFKKLFNQGMIGGEDGQKMSKSRGNVVNPDDVVDKYGADSFRVYEMFMGPLDKSKPWNTKGLQGSYRFIQKVWKIFIENREKLNDDEPSKETLRQLHQTIKKVTEDLNTLNFNTAVSQMMIFVNHILTLENYNNQVLRQFLILLNPYAPHISEEIYEILGYNINGPISSQNWPNYDENLLIDDQIKVVVQINGKTRGMVNTTIGSEESDIVKIIRKEQKLMKYFYGMHTVKTIYVPKKLINFVLRPKQ
ncbi:MAG: leucine--tRNA ligase [bacterium]